VTYEQLVHNWRRFLPDARFPSEAATMTDVAAALDPHWAARGEPCRALVTEVTLDLRAAQMHGVALEWLERARPPEAGDGWWLGLRAVAFEALDRRTDSLLAARDAVIACPRGMNLFLWSRALGFGGWPVDSDRVARRVCFVPALTPQVASLMRKVVDDLDGVRARGLALVAEADRAEDLWAWFRADPARAIVPQLRRRAGLLGASRGHHAAAFDLLWPLVASWPEDLELPLAAARCAEAKGDIVRAIFLRGQPLPDDSKVAEGRP